MSGAVEPPSFSRPPLDALLGALDKGYVGVHVEQGVPVLDRDLNLLGDLVHATLRRIVARYIGDGVAAGSEAFAIVAVDEDEDEAGDNDFAIGAGAHPPGRCLVGGIEVRIDAPVRYREQEGEDLPDLTTPGAGDPDPRADSVYLDVWLEEEAGEVDSDLHNPADVGLRTSTRAYPAWRVRVAEGGDPPKPARGHVHYLIARLDRPRGADRIAARHITDLRRTHLNLAALEGRVAVLERLPEQLVPDLFDVAPGDYEDGAGRPQISARAALNALMRGQVPGTPLRPLADPVTEDGDAHAARLPDGTTVAAWVQRFEDEGEVMVRRLRQDVSDQPPRQITHGENAWGGIQVVPLAGDRVLVSYHPRRGRRPTVQVARFKIASVDDLADADDHVVPHRGPPAAVRIVRTGGLLTFLVGAVNRFEFLRLRWDDAPEDWWVDDAPQDLFERRISPGFSAVTDEDGRVWVAFQPADVDGVAVLRFAPEDSTPSVEVVGQFDVLANPTLHRTHEGELWLFAHVADELFGLRFDGEEWRPDMMARGQTSSPGPVAPIDGGDGALWLFWRRQVRADTQLELAEVDVARRDPETGGWSRPGAATPAMEVTSAPIAVPGEDPGSVLLICGLSRPDGPQILHHRRVVTVF